MRKSFSGVNNPRWSGGKIQLNCSNCGSIIWKWKCRIKEKNYCDQSCAHKNKHPKTEFKKGHIPWVKGIHGIHLNPLGEFKNGHNPWNKNKPFLQVRGENHWNWKGGINPLVLKIRKSLEYKKWVKSIFERDDYICQICKKRGGNLEADHIVPFSVIIAELIKIFGNDFNQIVQCDLLWKLDNGRTLCEKCHKETDTYLSKVKNYKLPLV